MNQLILNAPPAWNVRPLIGRNTVVQTVGSLDA